MSSQVEQKIGYSFNDRSLLEEALTHSSYANEHALAKFNERLEFLGDAVLELCVSEELFLSRPDWDEGRMTDARTAIVREESLARWGRQIGLVGSLRLGRSLGSPSSLRSQSVLGDAAEAVIGAVYLDGGLDAAKKIAREVMELCGTAAEVVQSKDPKSRLQELLQAEGRRPPSYSLVARSGPDHDARFTVELSLDDGQVWSSGTGSSIKAAEFRAAEEALRKFGA